MPRLDAADVAKAVAIWEEGRKIRDMALRESEKSRKVPSAETMSQMDKSAETIRWLLRDADPNIAQWEPWGNWWNRALGFDVRKKVPVVLKSAEPINWKAIQDRDADVLEWFERLKDAAGPRGDGTPGETAILKDNRIIIGDRVIVLGTTERDVVGALAKLKAADLRTLNNEAGYNHAAIVLKRLLHKKGNEILRQFIVLPGGRGRGGYSTTIKLAVG